MSYDTELTDEYETPKQRVARLRIAVDQAKQEARRKEGDALEAELHKLRAEPEEPITNW